MLTKLCMIVLLGCVTANLLGFDLGTTAQISSDSTCRTDAECDALYGPLILSKDESSVPAI